MTVRETNGMIGTTISHYAILEKLGDGGMGVVFKAQDTKLKRLVALKFLLPELTRDAEARDRFVNEAQAAAALDHANICDVHEIGETADEQYFIVMAYYEGETLKQKLAHAPLSCDEALQLALQIAQGLAQAHEHDIAHRDIKPANIIVTKDGVVKILDFGLAKLAGQMQRTRIGSTLGTPAYMSPEQTYGEESDHRADIWAFGVLLYEMLTGQLPFRGEYEQAVIYSILNETPPPLTSLRPELPPQLERLVASCLAKPVQERYQKMTEVIADLQALKNPPPARARLSSAALRRKQIYLYGALGLLVAVLAASFLWRQPERAVPNRKSIAVLPFANLSPNKDEEYFSDGITEDVITQLAKIADLKVISRTSVMQYKGVYKNMRDIGKELEVATVLEGSVRRAGNHVRVAAQLIDAAQGRHLWAEVYDEEMKEIFAIQSDIARQIASALEARLSSPEQAQITKRPTGNLTAYDYYLKGREYYNHHDQPNYKMASNFFAKALQLDSTYALAYAGMADACAQQDLLDSAILLSRRALALDVDLPEAHKALGLAYYYKGWMQKSLEASLHATKLNANQFPALVNVGWALFETNPVEAIPWLRKAFVLAPTSASVAGSIGTAYTSLTDDANAESWLKKSIELAPDFLRSYYRLWRLYVQAGRTNEANAILQKIPASTALHFEVRGQAALLAQNYAQALTAYEKTRALDSTFQSLELAYAYQMNGRPQPARRMFDYFARRSEMRIAAGNERNWPRYDLARIHAARHETAAACAWLQKAIAAGWIEYRWARLDPLLESLRDEPQFQSLLREVQTKVEAMRKRLDAREQQ